VKSAALGFACLLCGAGCAVITQPFVATSLSGTYTGQARLATAGGPACPADFDVVWTVHQADSGYALQVGPNVLEASAEGTTLVFAYTHTQNVNLCQRQSATSVRLEHRDQIMSGSLQMVLTPACDGTGAASCTCSYSLQGRFTSDMASGNTGS
jgi:hypothetical protein